MGVQARLMNLARAVGGGVRSGARAVGAGVRSGAKAVGEGVRGWAEAPRAAVMRKFLGDHRHVPGEVWARFADEFEAARRAAVAGKYVRGGPEEIMARYRQAVHAELKARAAGAGDAYRGVYRTQALKNVGLGAAGGAAIGAPLVGAATLAGRPASPLDNIGLKPQGPPRAPAGGQLPLADLAARAAQGPA